MRYLRHLSLLILLAGVSIAILGDALDLGASVTLVGLMLVIAGIVKIVTVRIWHGYFAADDQAERERGT